MYQALKNVAFLSPILLAFLAIGCGSESEAMDGGDEEVGSLEQELVWSETFGPRYQRSSSNVANQQSADVATGRMSAQSSVAVGGDAAGTAFIERDILVPAFVQEARFTANVDIFDGHSEIHAPPLFAWGNTGAVVSISVVRGGRELCGREVYLANENVFSSKHISSGRQVLQCAAPTGGTGGSVTVRVTLRTWAGIGGTGWARTHVSGQLANIVVRKDTGAETEGDVLATDISTRRTVKVDDFFCVGDERCAIGTGMVRHPLVSGSAEQASLVAFLGNGEVFVGPLSGNPSTVQSGTRFWGSNVCFAGEVCQLGDLNGDGRDDVAAFSLGSGQAFISRNTGSRTLVAASSAFVDVCRTGDECRLADVNGDNFDDVVSFKRGPVRVALNNRSGGFVVQPTAWHSSFCVAGQTCAVGDVNGDGADDIISFASTGDVFVAFSNRSGFDASFRARTDFCRTGQECQVADVDRSGTADLVAFTRDALGTTRIAHSNSSGFFTSTPVSVATACTAGRVCAVAGRNEIVAFLR